MCVVNIDNLQFSSELRKVNGLEMLVVWASSNSAFYLMFDTGFPYLHAVTTGYYFLNIRKHQRRLKLQIRKAGLVANGVCNYHAGG